MLYRTLLGRVLLTGICSVSWAGGQTPKEIKTTEGKVVADSDQKLVPSDQIRFRLREDPAPGNLPMYVVISPLDDVQFPVSRLYPNPA